MTLRIIVLTAVSLFIACAAIHDAPPVSQAEAARAAVDVRQAADRAAIGACLTYRGDVLLGRAKPDEATDRACDKLIPAPPPACRDPLPTDEPKDSPSVPDSDPELRSLPS